MGAPGAVFVCSITPVSFAIWFFTNTYSAMSMAKAMSVSSAARKDANEARRITVTCVESESRNAMNVMAHAADRGSSISIFLMHDTVDAPTGCMARPRVQDAPTVCQLVLSELYTTVK